MNAAKLKFKTLCTPLQGIRVRIPVKREESPTKGIPTPAPTPRSVCRKNVEEIGDLLEERYQNIRANVLYARLDPKGRGRIQIAAELPLIYATDRRIEPSEVHFRADTDDPVGPQRNRKSKLEPEPYLRSIAAYRYTSGEP